MNAEETSRARVLSLLEKNRSRYLSGAEMARALHLSRNAVWKAVTELRRSGYQIDAATRKGYLLADGNDILSVQGMEPYLPEGFPPERIHLYDTLESTNRRAKEMAIADAPHGTVVAANAQSAGSGRYARSFFSPPGGIYFSLVLRPGALRLENPTLVTVLAAVAVCETLETLAGKRPRIKWVNDIFLNERKICGILTESATGFESGELQWIVLGIGMNYRLPEEALPTELQGIAGAVDPEGTLPFNRNRLIAELIGRILDYSGREHADGALIGAYRERLLMLGRQVRVSDGTSFYTALAREIDDAGRLIVEKKDGSTAVLSSGEVSIVP